MDRDLLIQPAQPVALGEACGNAAAEVADRVRVAVYHGGLQLGKHSVQLRFDLRQNGLAHRVGEAEAFPSVACLNLQISELLFVYFQ